MKSRFDPDGGAEPVFKNNPVALGQHARRIVRRNQHAGKQGLAQAFQPRAKVMQKTCHEVLDALGHRNDPLLKVALEIERIALQDEYFIEKKLYPNIDFYSGITLRAMGFPIELFTVLFALARTVGWIAQWKEMIEDPEQRIGRPRQLYVGAPRRDFPAE